MLGERVAQPLHGAVEVDEGPHGVEQDRALFLASPAMDEAESERLDRRGRATSRGSLLVVFVLDRLLGAGARS